MALYPAIFVLYLGKFSPALTDGWYGYAWSLAVVVVCSLWNLRGAPAVGDDSLWMSALLLAPFAVFVIFGLWHGITAHPHVQWGISASGAASESALSMALLVAMWNYMGWDNASTVAQEVENPQRNYPRAMIVTTILVAVAYILPLTAMALSGLSAGSFKTGDWMTAATSVSYTRLPMAMAEDGMLPRAVARRNSRGVPWVSVLLCGLAWAMALKLPFEKLISIDLILYGTSLLLEFVALIVLRVREPNLERPFKAGNLAFAASLGVGPAALIGYALYASRAEKLMGTTSALLFAVVVGLLGPVLYWLTAAPRARRLAASAASAAD
jgi:amino acid transporter